MEGKWHGHPPAEAWYEQMARDIVEIAKTAPRKPRPATVRHKGTPTMNRLEKKMKAIEQENAIHEVEGLGVF